MKDNFTKFFYNEDLPYIEARYSNSNKHYKEHIHETFSIGVNLFGDSLYTNKENKYSFKPNMFAIINPLDVHSCNCIGDENNEYYMLYLDKTWCFQLQKELDPSLKEFKTYSKEILEDKELYIEFLELNKLLFSNELSISKECEIIKFFTKLFSKDLKSTKLEDSLAKGELKPILEYFDKNYKSNITLNNLSSKFNLNTFYIIRLFNESLKISPHQYLLNLKINRAKELLKQNYSLVDTALECGFTDQSHFHRNFVNIVATTPRKFQINFIQ